MPLEHREELARITNFTDLVSYLHERMDWPIETTDFDDLTFEYTADELGIDANNAAKISEIRRLRPLVAHQPWGIFFVQFERKRLPVVALRRMLAQLVFKKRASAGRDERPAWDLHDLLFISAFGTPEEPRICFAHFSEDELVPNQATLKVLNWDEHDTGLKLDHVIGQLTHKLAWPADENDLDAWRAQWRAAFTLRHRQVITTSRDLAIQLATLARSIRALILQTLEIETKTGRHHKLLEDFRSSLIHDLDEDGFADMYAQTITYGLLSARVSRQSGALVADDAALLVPETNPFLRELMENFLKLGGRTRKSNGHVVDFDELGINEVIETLRDANMEAVLRDFGDKNPQEDPVIHFYELFLKEYDAKKRMQRGVYYTPRPVVSYIVRSVDELLRTEFGLADGLADTATWADMAARHKDIQIPEGVDPQQDFVQILDPATGTGTFLVEVIGHIHKTLVDNWMAEGHSDKKIDALWNDYVPRHLLSRLHGYELMMAPYAIAHLKIGLKLHETGYKFQSHERARIYLTNALEPAHDFSSDFEFAIPALAHEAEAVNKVKRDLRFTVVIGNPPYSTSIASIEWIMELLKDWKRNLNEKKSDLNREEWKFLRFAQHQCSKSGAGLLSFVINRDFLDGIAKRRMREHLGQAFEAIQLVDLNGDVKGNISDDNVFDIEQGVAIGIFSTKHELRQIRYASLVGERISKYNSLLDRRSIVKELQLLQPTEPYFRWTPSQNLDSEASTQEYTEWTPLSSVFQVYSSGIQTKRDKLCVASDSDELWSRVQEFAQMPDNVARERFALPADGRDWTISQARSDLLNSGPDQNYITPILYRPFDIRYTYWTGRTKGFVAYPRRDVMEHVLKAQNIGLIFNRQIVGDEVSHFAVSRIPICHGTFYLGNKGQDYFAPIRRINELFVSGKHSELESNFAPRFMNAFSSSLGIPVAELDPYVMLGYLYAIVHSPIYRTRYFELLKMDFPRVPTTKNLDMFNSLAALGDELISFHLLESPKLADFITKYQGPQGAEVGRVGWSSGNVWLDAGKTNAREGHRASKPGTIGFQGVPEAVWDFHIGGYQVCHKWLKDRKGRTLKPNDIAHYQKIVVALHETIRLMQEIDEVINHHGGWPGAFQTK